MKYFIAIIIAAVLQIACNQQEPAFLANFVEKSKKGPDFQYTKQISKPDLEILMATDQVNVQLYNLDHKYYYGYKEKLDERYYLVEFTNTYRAGYRFKHELAFWEDVFLCIYDAKENKVISKLRVGSSDPIQSFYKEQNHTYTITSDYFVLGCSDVDCKIPKLRRKQVTHIYKIIDNRFQLVEEKK